MVLDGTDFTVNGKMKEYGEDSLMWLDEALANYLGGFWDFDRGLLNAEKLGSVFTFSEKEGFEPSDIDGDGLTVSDGKGNSFRIDYSKTEYIGVTTTKENHCSMGQSPFDSGTKAEFFLEQEGTRFSVVIIAS